MYHWFEDLTLAVVAPGVGFLVSLLNSAWHSIPSSYMVIMWVLIIGLDTVIAVNRLKS